MLFFSKSYTKQTLVILLSFLSLVGCQNPTSTPSKFKTILLKSDGEVEILPNMAMFFIDLSCLDNSVKKAKTCLVDKSNDLVTLLQSFGVDKNDILTTSVNLNKSYIWKNNSSVFQGYLSSTKVYVTVKNIDKLDEMYTELLEHRNLELGGLSYSHSKLDSLKNEAYIKALANANALTDKLLSKLPETQKDILKIGNIEISSSTPSATEYKLEKNLYESSNLNKTKSIAINKGTVSVNATLFVEYLIQ